LFGPRIFGRHGFELGDVLGVGRPFASGNVGLYDVAHVVRLLGDHVLPRREHDVEQSDRRVVRIHEHPALTGEHVDGRAGFRTDVGIDVARGQGVRHVAEAHPHFLNVGRRHRIHLEEFVEYHFLRRSALHADLLAFEIGERLRGTRVADDDGHGFAARRRDDDDGLTAGSAERCCRKTEDAEINAAAHHRVLTVGRAVERDHLIGDAGRREFLIELHDDRVDGLQHADFDRARFGRSCERG